MDLADSSSDGEITNDLSDISEDDYFDNLASMIEQRKLELELMNEIEGKTYDDFPKENRYANNRNHQNFNTVRRRANNNNINNNNNNNASKDKSRNPRSYRASSVFSTSYSMPKRRKNERQNRRRRKYSKTQQQQKSQPQQQQELKQTTNYINLSSDNDEDDKNAVKVSIKRRNESESEEEDEELLSLRLQALTSKQEVKELIEPEAAISEQSITVVATITPASSPVNHQLFIAPNEEELLRIAALRSAVLKKKDQIKARKKLRKIENERPYSPTDIFEPIAFDDAMELSNSPLGSPFNSILDEDINQEVDMDISNSLPVTPEPLHDIDNHETSDMELVLSPQKPPEDYEEHQQQQQQQQEQQDMEQMEEENEEDLRSMLLCAMNEKKKDQKIITKNLKMAVERLKQQKQPPPIVVAQKSGTKTIKMILEEKTKKTTNPQTTPKQQAIDSISETSLSVTSTTELPANDPPASAIIAPLPDEQSETFLLTKITNAVETYSKPPSPVLAENAETSFSTITDTKNIPLLPQHQEVVKKRDNRLIMSLDSVIKPVSPLIISLQTESSDDEYARGGAKKGVRKVTRGIQRGPNEFEQNLDNFLKNIRMSQEKKTTQYSSTSNSAVVSKSNVTQSKSSETAKMKTQSAVKHLPLSSQMEYENLLKKMEILQQKKKQRHQLRQLKRTKSASLAVATTAADEKNADVLPMIIPALPAGAASSSEIKETKLQQVQVQKAKDIQTSANKIDDTLSKISLLDEAARQRLIDKTEINFRNHSKNLMDSTQESLKTLDESSLQIRQRRIVEAKIQELEKSLTKYKSILKVVNSRIKTNIPKVIQSQRDMIKFRNHQYKFKEICKRVGENVRGDEYRLPDDQSAEIVQNFVKISEKTEDLHHAFKEQYASKQLKLLADKVKSFVPEMEPPPASPIDIAVQSAATEVSKLDSRSNNDKSETKDKVASDEKCVIVPSDNKVTEESEEVPLNIYQSAEEVAPELHMEVYKVLESSSPETGKRLALYNSPLEYLKDNSRSKSVNQVVCPFALEGSCSDEKCKMLHL